jgi:hypothetical protein
VRRRHSAAAKLPPTRSVLQEQRWNNQGQAVQEKRSEKKKLTYYLELKTSQ